ncbi:MAG: hypothetical protein QF521_16385, partial [Alphaproteobacteria bacterium]|nr:hypothetical protein [Alphaproteobacteria bacterium]
MKSVSTMVAEPIGYGERFLIQDFDKPGGVSLRCHIHLALQVHRGDGDEWGAFDPGSTNRIDVIDRLLFLALEFLTENGLHFFRGRNRFLGLVHKFSPGNGRHFALAPRDDQLILVPWHSCLRHTPNSGALHARSRVQSLAL